MVPVVAVLLSHNGPVLRTVACVCATTIWVGGIPLELATEPKVREFFGCCGAIATVIVERRLGVESWALVTFMTIMTLMTLTTFMTLMTFLTLMTFITSMIWNRFFLFSFPDSP